MRKTVLICLAGLLLMSRVAAQNERSPKLPDTPAGRRVAAYIKAFNSGDEQLMRAFIVDNVSAEALRRRPVAARLEVYREMRDRMQTMELRSVSEAREDRVTALVETRSGEWVEIGFEFEPQPPHKLLGLLVKDVDAPPSARSNPNTASAPSNLSAAAPLTETEAVAAVASYLEERARADEFSGAVLLAKGDHLIFRRAYGLASKEYNVPNREDTKFNLGSINKIFTQVAVGQLIEQGKLSLDDTLGKYLPDYPNRQAADKVTVRHLLDMRSGIGDFFSPEFDRMPKDKLRAVKDFLPLFAAAPLAFEPGTKQQYSNGGYIVLGAIVEKVSGEDYYEYVREHIFKPAGMQNTDWYETDIPTPNMANGYTREGAGASEKNARRNNVYTRPAKGSPAGGGYSTADDLFKFALALQARALRIPEFRASATAAQANSTGAKTGGFSGAGIAGGAPGINALLIAGAEGGYTVIVMSNYDPPVAEQVGKELRGLLARIKN
ncbi:MAG TPA: serine hydrolase domain-containing protein [Pyrinomonadaceae bacterium]|nr:serine hydrolase domain-containing protein [Pyrinomonadaceae bacterium]